MGSVAKSYMRKGFLFLLNEEKNGQIFNHICMRRPLCHIPYDFATTPI